MIFHHVFTRVDMIGNDATSSDLNILLCNDDESSPQHGVLYCLWITKVWL